MELTARQQEAVQDLRDGKIAEIDKGETAKLSGKLYPAAMFDFLANIGMCRRYGDREKRTWHRR